MRDPDVATQALVAAFKRIRDERMDGVPILNARLEVEAVGTRVWNSSTLTVLITPWFINLMLLPGSDEQAEAWNALTLTSGVLHRFPAGRFDFLVGEEAGVGRYQMCSLFSPVLEFEDQEAARIASTAALDALFDASLDPAAEKKAEAGTGTESAPENAVASPVKVSTPIEPSRRGFLSGRLAPREGSA